MCRYLRKCPCVSIMSLHLHPVWKFAQNPSTVITFFAHLFSSIVLCTSLKICNLLQWSKNQGNSTLLFYIRWLLLRFAIFYSFIRFCWPILFPALRTALSSQFLSNYEWEILGERIEWTKNFNDRASNQVPSVVR